MDLSSVKRLNPQKSFLLTRNVFGPDHQFHPHDFVVKADSGPLAVEMVRYLVAEEYKRYAPKQPSKKSKPKPGTKGFKPDDDDD